MSHGITSTIGADNNTLVQELTFSYNYGWLSLTSMGPHDISGKLFPPTLKYLLQLTDISFIVRYINEGGCPIDVQPWCGYTSAIRAEQLIAGFVLIVTGFPMGAAMTNSIFSKIIGPFPQVCCYF
jgi:hypothetical protein